MLPDSKGSSTICIPLWPPIYFYHTVIVKGVHTSNVKLTWMVHRTQSCFQPPSLLFRNGLSALEMPAAPGILVRAAAPGILLRTAAPGILL